MWESFRDLKYRFPNHCFTEKILKGALDQLSLALDYLHTEWQLVRTGAKNISAHFIRLQRKKDDLNAKKSLLKNVDSSSGFFCYLLMD